MVIFNKSVSAHLDLTNHFLVEIQKTIVLDLRDLGFRHYLPSGDSSALFQPNANKQFGFNFLTRRQKTNRFSQETATHFLVWQHCTPSLLKSLVVFGFHHLEPTCCFSGFPVVLLGPSVNKHDSCYSGKLKTTISVNTTSSKSSTATRRPRTTHKEYHHQIGSCVEFNIEALRLKGWTIARSRRFCRAEWWTTTFEVGINNKNQLPLLQRPKLPLQGGADLASAFSELSNAERGLRQLCPMRVQFLIARDCFETRFRGSNV